MIDQDVTCLLPSTVYRIQTEEGLVSAWERQERGKGKVPTRPTEHPVREAPRGDLLPPGLRGCDEPKDTLLGTAAPNGWGHGVSLAALAALETLPDAERRLVHI